MFKVSRSSPKFLRKLIAALETELNKVGIPAEIKTEPVRGTRLHRIQVLSDKFKRMQPSERQDFVWRIVDRELSPEEQLRISMILTLTPDECEGA